MTIQTLRILICDDSVLARKKLKDYLATLEVKAIYEAIDGQDAIDKYKEFIPDLVFMDIVMPKKTGIEAVTEILKLNPKAKVVMASSVGTQNHLKDAINAGAYEFLQKPIENSHVLKIIQNMIKEA